MGKFIGVLVLALQIVALLGTGSRMGWLAMIIAAIGLAALIPRRIVVFSIVGVLALTGISIFLNQELLARVLDLTQNFWAVSTQRHYLITSGIQMFLEHPVQGIGLAGFQEAMLTTYASVVQNGVSLSHTAVVTTAAELGIIGLGILVVFFAVLYGRVARIRKALQFSREQLLDARRYYWEIFAILAITTIFVSAQGEGRFLEDPYLWILVGYLTAVRNHEEVS